MIIQVIWHIRAFSRGLEHTNKGSRVTENIIHLFFYVIGDGIDENKLTK